METQDLFSMLGRYHPLSAGLKSYLLTILRLKEVAKGKLLLMAGQIPDSYWYIHKGSARVYVDSGKSRQNTLWFWNAQELMYSRTGFFTHTPGKENIQMMEDSILYCIPYNHIDNLVRLFPEFYEIEKALQERHLGELIEHGSDLKTLSAVERYTKLQQRQPKLFNIAYIKDIASFMGIYPDTLSHFRSRY
jgi:CRP-like cAMP-binding protein